MKTTLPPAPGLHQNVPLVEYLGWDCWSCSTIKEGLESMAHAKASKDDEMERKVTDDMFLGSAMHCAFLEPELMPTKVICWDGGTRRGKEWDAFSAEHAGKVILTENTHAKLIGMSRSLRKHPQVRQWLSAIDATEVSAVGMLEGVLMKGRADALLPVPVIDLKKVRSGNRRSMWYTVRDFRYDIQAAIYTRLFGRTKFILLTVEDAPPYDVVPYELPAERIEAAWRETVQVLHQIRQCEKAARWPGRCDGIETLDEPTWANNSEVSIS